ncbi:MAG: acetate kinase [Armatimonadota bacterium]|nr:MAG: acetate kinase [Armatimonadota bacterium]
MSDILVLNCGSSSVKYRLFDVDDESAVAQGLIERIGEEVSYVSQRTKAHETGWAEPVPTYERAFEILAHHLVEVEDAPLPGGAGLLAVGHRVVHGGEAFVEPSVIDEDVIRAIHDCIPLAPLHNPANLAGIEAARRHFPDAPHVAVFDTAFHHTMPREAYLYAIPYELYEQHGVRRYGFHGTSHRYAAGAAAEMLGRDLAELRLITCHLGNGCSLAAVAGGRSIDSSMGMTPLEGIPMGTRSGDLDPGLFLYLHYHLGMSIEEIDHLFNKCSGLLGLSGMSNDLRPIEQAAAAGDERPEVCLEVFAYRVKKYIGAYLAALGGADAVVFTGGMGEHSPEIRARICAGLEGLGLRLDAGRNEACGDGQAIVSPADCAVAVLVIPSNEELLIARDASDVVSARRAGGGVAHHGRRD